MSPQLRLKALGWIVIMLLLLSACNSATPVPPTPAPELPLLNEAIKTVTQVASDPSWTPPDAVPSPDAQWVYFTANGNAGGGVYKVASTGGEITALVTGAPLVAPLGLTISHDGQTLYVADLDGEKGLIYAVPTGGGAPTPLAKTAGSQPHVPEIVTENGAEMLYYSGVEAGQPAILKLNPAKDEAPTVVFKGSPLVAPSGVAVTKNGVVYVVDMAASGAEMGAVFQIQNGKVEKLADALRTSQTIAGAALTLDESALLVSNLHVTKNTAQVLLINLTTHDLALINKGIADNLGAGGVHRAHDLNQFAWSDYTPPSRRGTGGQNKSSDNGAVYFLTTP